VHVQRLRAKVEKDPENPTVVLTVRGVGYKAGPPWSAAATPLAGDVVMLRSAAIDLGLSPTHS